MTDTSTILKNSYNGNGSATSFDYEFKILDASELVVVKTDNNGLDTTLTLNTDYTVSGVGDNNGGRVTYPVSGAPLANGERLTLYPTYSLTQTIDFTNQDKAYFELFEEGLDRANFKIKMLQEQINRSIKIGVTSLSNPEDYLTDAADYAAQAGSAASSASDSAAAAGTSEANALSYAQSINIPTNLSGHANAFLRIKGDETGYEFTTSAPALMGQANTFTADQTVNATLDAAALHLDGTDITPHLAQGECRLEYSSITQVKLERYNGKSLMLWDGNSKWVPAHIPAAGIAYDFDSSFSADTLYYIYAYLNNGNVALASSTSAPSEDSDTGYMVLPTADKYLCVGMIYLDSNKEVTDEFMVASFFNRRPRTKRASLSADVSTTSTSYVEVSTQLRCPFLVWSGDEAMAKFNGMQYSDGDGIINEFFMAVDGAAAGDRIGSIYQDVTDNYHLADMSSFTEQISGQAQGYHYATMVYSTYNASHAVTFKGSSSRTSNLNITTLG